MGTGIFLLLLLFVCGPVRGAAGSDPASPEDGRRLFREKGCIQCHAVFGKGGRRGPDLGEDQFFGTYLELCALMWNHLPMMSRKMKSLEVEFPQLRPDEFHGLILYLSYIHYLGPPGNDFRGRKLLESKNCVKCHRFGGQGGKIGPDISLRKDYLSPLHLLESMWNHGPEMREIFQQSGIERPRFYKDEIVDLFAGIQSYMSPSRVPPGSFAIGNPDRGRILIRERGCLHCHSLRGEGGTLGPDFDGIDLRSSVVQLAGRMWNHGPEMWRVMQEEQVTFPVFEKGDMADLVSYIYRVKMEDPPGNPESGRALFRARGCSSCHRLRGEEAGGTPDRVPLGGMGDPIEMIAKMWNHSPDMQRKQKERGMDWPELDGRDMADLYAFLGEVEATAPGGE